MVTSCNFITPTGSKSDLIVPILEEFGPVQALKFWTTLHSEKALNIHNWYANSAHNTEKGELIPGAAASLYNSVVWGSEFNPNSLENIRPKIDLLNSIAESNVPEKTVDLKVNEFEAPNKFVSGAKDLVIRQTNKTGLAIGEVALTYINGFPFRVEYEGVRGSEEDIDGYLNRLNLLNANDIKEKSAKEFFDGNKRHLFKIMPLFEMSEILKDEFNIFQESSGVKEINPAELHKTMKSMLVEYTTKTGQPTGRFFTPELQKASIDTVMLSIYGKLKSHFDSGAPLNSRVLYTALAQARQEIKQNIQKYLKIAKGEPGEVDARTAFNLTQPLIDTYYTFDQVAKFTMERLGQYGFKLGDNTIKNIEAVLRDSTIQDFDNITIEQLEDFEEEITEEEGKGLRDWTDSAFELNPKDTASSHLKLFLSTIIEHRIVDKKHKPVTNQLGSPVLVDFNNLLIGLFDQVQGLKRVNYNSVMKLLKKSHRGNFRAVAEKVESASQQTKNEFLKVLSKQNAEQLLVLFTIKNSKGGDRDLMVAGVTNTNRSNKIQTLIDSWRELQKNSPFFEELNGRLTVNKRSVKTYVNKLAKLRTAEDINEYGLKLLNSMGVKISQEASQKIPDFNTIVHAFAQRLQGLIVEGKKGQVEQEVYDDAIKNNNPLYNDLNYVRQLASAEVMYGEETPSADMSRNGEGKPIYAYSLHTYESHLVKELVEGLDESSRYSGLKLQYLDGLKPSHKKDGGVTRPKMSKREQSLMAISMFQAKAGKTANFLDMVKSDKSTTAILAGIRKLDIRTDEVTEDIVDEFEEVFNQEFERIAKWERLKDTFPNDQWAKGGGLFYFIPQYNYEEMKKLASRGIITKEEFNSVWNDGGSINASGDPIVRRQLIKKWTTSFIGRMVTKTVKNWNKQGIVSGGHVWFDQFWVKKAYKNLKITKDPELEDTFYIVQNGEPRVANQEFVNRMIAQYAAFEYNVNYFLTHTWAATNISGDPATAYKGNPSDSQLNQVKDTLTEYTKRLAKDIAPGSDPAWANEEETYINLVIDDPKLTSLLSQYNDKYSNFDSGADAQEVTTVKEHLYVMYSEGKIPDNIYQEMTAIIEKGSKSKDGYYEFKEPTHLAIVMNAMKPVYVGKRKVEGIDLIDYIKSSSFPLLPQYTKGNELDKLRIAMEKGNIARAAFKSAKKLGRPRVPVKVFNNDGRIDEAIFKTQEFKSAQQVLSRKGFRIQQEVPYKEDKKHIQMVTQMNKLLTEGILKMVDFSLPESLKSSRPLTNNQLDSSLITKKGTMYFDYGTNKRADIKSKNTFDAIVEGKRTSTTRFPEDGNYWTDTKIGDIIEFWSGSSVGIGRALYVKVKGINRIDFKTATDEELENWSKAEGWSKEYAEKKRTNKDRTKGAQIHYELMRSSKVDGQGIKQLKSDIRIKTMELHYQNFLKEVGAEEYSNPDLDAPQATLMRFKEPSKFINRLVQEATARNYPKNDIEALRHTQADGSLTIPLWFNNSASRVESMMMSLVKKIVINKMSGRSFIQASSLGFKGIGTEIPSGTKFIEGYDPSKGLESIRKDKDGNVLPAQVVVPFNFFDTSGKALKLEDFLDESGRIDNTKLPDELRHFIGARIPNQGHNSMLPIEIVGFIPANMGDLMIVPAAITVQMGSDFDVDKLYVYKKNYSYSDGALSVLSKTITELGTSENESTLQNDYFDVHWSVLNHPDVFNKIINPLDKPDLKDEKYHKIERENSTEFSNYFHIDSQLDDYLSQVDAKALVALTSLSSTFSASIQGHNLRLTKLEYDGEKFAKVDDYVSFRDEITGEVLNLHSLSGEGKSQYRKEDGGSEFEERSKHDNLTTIQNAALDHAKERLIDYLNINLATYPAASAMSMLSTKDGRGISLKYTTRLMQQEVIYEFVERMSEGNDSLSKNYVPNLKVEVIDSLKNKYAKLANIEIDYFKDYKRAFNPQELQELLNTKDKNSQYYLRQLEVLAVFEKLDEIGSTIAEIQGALNADTKGAGKNVLDAVNKLERIQEVTKQSLISGVETLVSTRDERGFASSKTVNLVNDLYTQLLPYNKMTEVFEGIKLESLKPFLGLQDKQLIADSIKSLIYTSKSVKLSNDPSRELAELLYDTEAGESLAKRVLKAKLSWAESNHFLERIDTNISTNKDLPSTISYSFNKTGEFEDYENTKAFISLMKGSEEQVALAHDLIKYAYLTGGNSADNSFIKYIPVAYLTGTDIAENLRTIADPEFSWESILSGFVQQFFQHNPDMAPKLSPSLEETLEYTTGELSENVNEFITLPPIGSTENKSKNLIVDRKTEDQFKTYPSYVDYLSVRVNSNWVLYKRISQNKFQRIDILGKGSISEYDATRSNKRSIFLTNRAINPLADEFNEYEGYFDTYPTNDVIDEVIDNRVGIARLSDVVQSFKEDKAPLLHLLNNIIAKSGVSEVTVDTLEARTGINASYKVDDRIISLNPKYVKSKAKLTTVLTHETAHAVTARIISDIESLSTEDAISKYGQETITAYQNLVRIMEDVKDLLPTNKKNSYALSSVDEFVAHALTDKTFQKLLNGVKSEDRSMWEKFGDLISSLISAVAKQFGIQVDEGTVLYESLANISVLLEAQVSPNEQPNTGKTLNSITDLFEEFDNETYIPENVGTSLNQLEALKKRLEERQSVPSGKTLTTEERVEFQQRNAELQRLDEELKDLYNNVTIKNLLNVSKRQIEWAEGILSKEDVSYNEFLSSRLVGQTWSSIVEELYKNTNLSNLPEGIDSINGKANELAAKSIKMFKDKVVDADGSLISSLKDFSDTKTGWGSSQFRDLSKTRSVVGQELNNKLTSAYRQEKTKTTRFAKSVQDMNKLALDYAKEKGLKVEDVYAKFINEKGSFTDVFSGEFYNFQFKLRNSLYSKINAAKMMKSEKEKAAFIKEAFKEYNQKVKDNMMYVDSSIFFDEEGNLTSGDSFNSERAKLVSEVGEDLAATMIDKAQRLYREYLEDRDSYVENLEVSFESKIAKLRETFEKEVKLLTPEARAKFLSLKAKEIRIETDNQILEWERRNSPNMYYRQLRGLSVAGTKSNFRTYSRLVMVPKRKASAGNFYDVKFSEIMNDPKLKEMYDFLRSKMELYKSYLPSHVAGELHDNFMPIIERADSLIPTGKNWTSIKRTITNALTAEEDYIEYVNSDSKTLPIRYTKGNVPLEDRETNPFLLVGKFGKMAIHYQSMNEIQAYVELLQQSIIMETTKSTSGKFDQLNESSKALADQVKYTIDSLMYQAPKAQEGKIGNFYSLDPIKQKRVEKEILELKRQRDEIYTKYANREITITEYSKQLNDINAKLADPKYRVLLASKIGDVAIKVTQLKALAYNPFSAIANIGFGLVSMFTHANGRVDFGQKEAMSAFTTMLNATGKSVSFGTFNPDIAKKIMALMERLDIMDNVVDTDMAGESKFKVKKNKIKQALEPHELMRQSDYFMKGMIAVAMAKKQMIEVNGESISLWEALDNDAKIESSEWFSEDVTKETEFQSFQKRVIGVSKSIMGNQDNASPLLIKRKILGRLVSQFRISWAAEGFASRFEGWSTGERFDQELQRNVRGRYATMKDLGVIGSLKTLFMQTIGIFSSAVDPFSNKKRDGSGLTATDIENMRKNLAEIAFYLSIFAAVLALKASYDDDDDKDSAKVRALKTMVNILIRNRQDITFYSSPTSFEDLTKSAIPAMKVLTDGYKAVGGTFRLLAQGEDEDSRFGMEEAGMRWMKAIPYLSLYPKFKYMWSRYLDE